VIGTEVVGKGGVCVCVAVGCSVGLGVDDACSSKAVVGLGVDDSAGPGEVGLAFNVGELVIPVGPGYGNPDCVANW
jgi:hypothetical protein